MNHYQNIEMQKVVRFWESQRTMTGLNNSDVELWKSKIEFLDTISMQHNVIVFLLDTFRNRFIYMSDKLKILSGVDPSFYLAENGIEFSASRIHPDHMQANLEILKLGVNLLTKHSKNYENNIFCYNFLYKNGNDEYVQVLQKSMILEVDDNGSPTLLLSFGHYVGHIKKHQSIGSVLATPHSITIYNYDHVKNVIGPPVTFSNRKRKLYTYYLRAMIQKA